MKLENDVSDNVRLSMSNWTNRKLQFFIFGTKGLSIIVYSLYYRNYDNKTLTYYVETTRI